MSMRHEAWLRRLDNKVKELEEELKNLREENHIQEEPEKKRGRPRKVVNG